jgi:hypothetical protein
MTGTLPSAMIGGMSSIGQVYLQCTLLSSPSTIEQ